MSSAVTADTRMTATTDRAATAVPVRPAGTGKRRAWYGAGGVGIVLLLVVGWSIHRHSAATMATGNDGGLVEVKLGTVEKTVDSAGTVVSNLDVDIKCRASGEIVKLPFERSQRIHKGELLCQLDPTDEQLAVDSAQADVDLSTAKVEQSKQTYETAKLNLQTTRDREEAALASAKVKAANLASKAARQQQLIDQQLGSKEEYETAQTDAAAAQADERSAEVAIDELRQQALQLATKETDVRVAEIQLRKDQTSLVTAKRQLAYTTVDSPVDGVVATVSVPLGFQVQSGTGGFSGGTTIMTVSDLSKVFVLATVDQSDVSGVKVDQQARVKFDSFPDRVFAGQVVRKSPVGVTTSNVTTFEVKVEVLDEHKDLLAPQMTGTVTIVEDHRDGALHVPTAAVTREAGKAYVTMKGGARRDVAVGLAGSDEVEITSGLSAGESVVLGTDELPTKWKSNSQGGPPPR